MIYFANPSGFPVLMITADDILDRVYGDTSALDFGYTQTVGGNLADGVALRCATVISNVATVSFPGG